VLVKVVWVVWVVWLPALARMDLWQVDLQDAQMSGPAQQSKSGQRWCTSQQNDEIAFYPRPIARVPSRSIPALSRLGKASAA
jgi:hypothetical protein